MDNITKTNLPILFERFSEVFAEQKDALIALDSKVGDSDLGLTMAKGFAAATAAVSALEDASVETQLKTAGVAIARAAPSTMGTLMATGFMRGSAAVKDCEMLGTVQLADFWVAFRDGVAQRGRVQVGDKTVVDVLHPIAETMIKQAESGAALTEALHIAYASASEALEATKDLVAQHGKAAAFQEKTRGIQDAGSTVAVILIKAMADFVSEL
ncbi:MULTISPECIES: dihydroxyacetone kinase subunit L [Gammaproteobacteria]|uniref:Dihydroxyacetone kinase-like protein n=1 Tax=Marinomonas foliarum TaxID=491950 RepID=A0A368ZKR2_9GAMM|nr:dihydroxyacetone kinase subunit L [Marinomonas foliarum]RCW93034.1 dihydroxyacetone kinase-like protein [Marinomonas foliarum]